ncbi:unnamed protein product [Penicillium salamii]|uniref:Sex determining protein n=1 Tax=Penicillium salamii TaxID=1612424 RepID=A0A9W4NPT5_9EURO|nr:unnamed protein product [Penicillium salamii]CAG8047394.1 unnamed protein product [Penicillium salamii]CAG8147355.1 unnamed protein product [Penicillium salamii]CAG8210421.1 unnamed protein product [Penicillium salamii]CAG8317679.1 unnamed protein product [Penicillium salamii]
MPHTHHTHPEYSHTYRPNAHTFSALPPGLGSGYSPASEAVSAVVQNSPASGTTVEGSEETHGRTIPGGSQAGLLTDDLYYAPMPVGGQNPGDGSVLMPTPTRGTKRSHETTEDDSSRQHRRLTTKEEVALFDICNQHADTFGSRSNLCKWWQSVATEFQRTHHGRSYSWHSVRRKVEVVTRQRIKFLEDRRNRTTNAPSSAAEELMNPQWLAAVDAWIPTWQRWEESENRRIAKRDEIKKRRQPQPWRDSKTEDWRNMSTPPAPSPDITMLGILPTANDIPASPSPPAAIQPAPFLDSPSTPASASTSLKLPPGFETMFSNPVQPPPSTPSAPPGDGRMVSAVLETLGKLNKHLDAASVGTEHSPATPVLSALVQAASETPSQSRRSPRPAQLEMQSHPTHGDIERMKEELRQEMQGQFRRELERSRAAMEEKLDSVQQTQEMILEMLRQEPGR